MSNAAARSRLSPEEYLAFERASEQRHEYADGEIFAMAGGTREHSLTATNLVGELRAALRGRRCEVHGSDLRIKIPSTGRYVYSDGVVVCGQPLFEDETRDTLLNPLVVIEVLSDLSEAYDRGDKFAQYQSIPSIKDYVLASQKAERIEHFRRLPDGTWLLRILGPGDRLVLESTPCEIAVDDAYLQVFAPKADEAG
jgi:Uma2 family endonuclease